MSTLIFRSYQHTAPSGATLGTLTQAFDKWVQLEDNNDGGGGFTIDRHDSQSAWCDPGNYIRVWIDAISGDADAGFWLEDGGHADVSEEEQGGQEWRFSGRGPIATLAEAIVWHREIDAGIGRVRAGEWRFDDQHAGGVLARLIEEAQARDCLPHVTLDFDADDDSNGDPWSAKARDWRIPIGEDLLTVVGELRESGLYVTMSPEFVLSAWDSHGTDLTGSVSFVHGTNIREAGERESHPAQAASVVLMEGQTDRIASRYKAVRDSTIETAIGRRKERHWRYPRTATRAVLKRVGERRLAKWKRWHDGPPGLGVIDLSGKTALTDYFPGDTVAIDIPDAVTRDERVAAITLADRREGAGEYDVTLEFGELSVGGSSYTGGGRDGAAGAAGDSGKPGDGSEDGSGRDRRPGADGPDGEGGGHGGCGCPVDLTLHVWDDFARTASVDPGEVPASTGGWWPGGNEWIIQQPVGGGLGDFDDWGTDGSSLFYESSTAETDFFIQVLPTDGELPFERGIWEALMRMRFTTPGSETDPGFRYVFFSVGGQDGLRMTLNTATSDEGIFLDGEGDDSVDKAIPDAEWILVRWESDGEEHRARFWQEDDPEPSSWDVTIPHSADYPDDLVLVGFYIFGELGNDGPPAQRFDLDYIHIGALAQAGELVEKEIAHGSGGIIDVGEAYEQNTLTVKVDDDKVVPDSFDPDAGTADLGEEVYHDPSDHPAGCAKVVVSYRKA